MLHFPRACLVPVSAGSQCAHWANVDTSPTFVTFQVIAVRRCASRRHRELVREKETVAAAATEVEAVEAPRPDEQYMRECDHAHLRQRLDEALGNVSANEADALRMSADGLSQEQIAARLGTTRGTVASWIKRGREKLRPQLADLVAA